MSRLLVSILMCCGFVPSLYSTDLYDEATLREARRLEKPIREIYLKGMFPLLTREEAASFEKLTFRFPLEGKQLLDFSAQPAAATVTLPIDGLLFLEDITTAIAWLQVNGFVAASVEEYVGMLKYQKPQSFEKQVFPPMLKTLGVPFDALKDKSVDSLSLRLRNSAYAFIIAHELGHIHHRHSSAGGTARESRKQEREADAFALSMLQRTGTIPMGAVVLFQTTAYLAPNRADFGLDQAGENEWENYVSRDATHPLTADRLRAISKSLRADSLKFAMNEQDKRNAVETIKCIAQGVDQIAEYLDDTFSQLAVAKYSSIVKPELLAPRKRAARPQLQE